MLEAPTVKRRTRDSRHEAGRRAGRSRERLHGEGYISGRRRYHVQQFGGRGHWITCSRGDWLKEFSAGASNEDDATLQMGSFIQNF
jgi:hypothetical protein